ncbi:MAG: 5'-nucleotidase C-terminal domain-containing protein [Bryobacterales bacterium]|nr:5'-nucleotidase C-terminal domain-containing protein [Bryobacterales bacterium]
MRLFVCLLLSLCSLAAGEARVTVLATTDMHGNLYPYDYFTAKPADRGLAKIATLIASIRAEGIHPLLIDCGDVIQGTPIETLYQEWVKTGHLPLSLSVPAGFDHDPMMAAMNKLGYNAMVVGNHEFNFGLKNLDRARSDAGFPCIAANIRVKRGASARPFAPYVVETINGVRVAVIGLTTPAVPTWEEPAHYAGYEFEDGVKAAVNTVREVRASQRPGIVMLAVHAGLDRDPKTGRVLAGGRENMVYQLAARLGSGPTGVDAIVFGHSHQELPQTRLNGVLLIQPKNWAASLARIDFVLDGGAGGWKIRESSGALLRVNQETPADPAMLALGRPYHELAEKYLSTPVAKSGIEMTGRNARNEDTALLDAVQRVQLHYAKADVSLSALFNPRVVIHRGPVTVRELAALYIYDNELYAIEGNGRMLREALENSARYFRSCATPDCDGSLINPRVFGFNFDMAEGVEYEIDLSQPEGRRIVNLRYRGKPLTADQPLRIAINNYRAGGSAGYTMFKNARILWKSAVSIRDLMIEYYTAHKQLPSSASNNWKIVPESAHRNLERSSR